MAISTINQNGLNAPLTLTSPVLTTPNLGTPSAINLSNATALPASAMPAGSVIQTVFANNGPGSQSASLNLVTLNITPQFSNSKILLFASATAERLGGGTGNYIMGSLIRNGSTTIMTNLINAMGYQVSQNSRQCFSNSLLDSPATTSSITYTLYADYTAASGVAYQWYNCTITAQEIKQ